MSNDPDYSQWEQLTLDFDYAEEQWKRIQNATS